MKRLTPPTLSEEERKEGGNKKEEPILKERKIEEKTEVKEETNNNEEKAVTNVEENDNEIDSADETEREWIRKREEINNQNEMVMKQFNSEIIEFCSKRNKRAMMLEGYRSEDSDDEDDDEEEESILTIEKLRSKKKIFIDPEVTILRNEIHDRLEKACGGLFLLRPYQTPIIVKIFFDYFNIIMDSLRKKNKNKYKEAFNMLLALTSIMDDYPHWYSFTSGYNDVRNINKLMKHIGKLWKILLDRKEFDFDEGLDGFNNKENLIWFLDKFANNLRMQDDDFDFNWPTFKL